MTTEERFETVIVGGGQAGLGLGYHLAERGHDFLILDAHERVGDAWRTRWDSLRLFTPARYNGLPGLRFPARGTSFPTKDEMADYLEDYARKYELPVRTGIRVDGVSQNGAGYVITSGRQRFLANNVVVATGGYQVPRLPEFAGELDPTIVQLHSTEYQNPSQLRDGAVLIVGLGNSGAEIAFELARTHRIFLSGKPSAQIPVRHGPKAARFFIPLIRFVGHHILTMGTPIGRKAAPKLITKAAPLIRVKLKDLAAAGVERVARTIGVDEGRPILEDGRVLDVANVIWCTGYRLNFQWIDLPVFGEDGYPVHERGVVAAAPGLYFMGLPFQYSMTSDTLVGVDRDAKYIAKHIASNGLRVRPVADAVTA